MFYGCKLDIWISAVSVNKMKNQNYFELIIKWVQNSKQELFVTLNVEWRTGDIKISLRMFVEAPIRQINRSFWPLPLLVSIPTCRNLSTWWTSAGVLKLRFTFWRRDKFPNLVNLRVIEKKNGILNRKQTYFSIKQHKLYIRNGATYPLRWW